MSEYRLAEVLVRNKRAGILKETDSGFSFSYCNSYLSSDDPSPISLTLPLTEKEYLSKTLFPFFDGLLPERWLLDLVIKKWKLSENDRFGILLKSCKDPVGNVSIKEVSI